MDRGFIEKMIGQMRCSDCGQQYERLSIDVLGQGDELWFVNIACPGCHSRDLIIIDVKEDTRAQVITDLDYSELSKFDQYNSVVADDVLEIYDFLKSFEGDFNQLFEGN